MNAEYEPEWSNYLNHFNKPNEEFNICNDADKYCVIVEPRSIELLILVIKNFMYLLQEKKWGLIIFHGTDNEEFIKNRLNGIANIHYININKPNLLSNEYNDLLCSYDFWSNIKEKNAKYVLIFQTDTLLFKNDLDEFMEYDYVGSPWSVKWMGMLEVGNGGLSIRNVDAMLSITKYCLRLQYQKNEDVYFCYWCIMRNFKIAPVDVAKKFAVETVYYDSPCGIHKPHIGNFPSRADYTKLFDLCCDKTIIKNQLLEKNKKENKEKSKNTHTQIRIRFFSSFCDGEVCKSHYETDFESHLLDFYGPDKKLYITNDDDYTHAVIMNTATPLLKTDIPIKNVIGLAFEPIYFLGLTAEFVEYAKKNISRYFIGDVKNLPSPFMEHTAYMWHNIPLKYEPTKNNLMSLMISEKGFAPGHKYRYELVNLILNTNLPIDIYGRGCVNFNKKDPRLKGEFVEKEPYENYYFHISIENFQCNEYFSEKIINPLLCSTMPIYLGCNNIKKYFNDDVICLTGDLNKDMSLIVSIINEPMKYYKKNNLEDIKNTTNFLRNIDNIFNIKQLNA